MKKLIISLLLILTLNINLLANEAPQIKVDVYVVKNYPSIKVDLKYPAIIKPAKKVDVLARVLGVLEKENFKEGDRVNEGDILFEIEDRIYKADLESAKASLRLSEVTSKNAYRKWQRSKRLFEKKAISEERRDDSRAFYDESLATVSIKKAQVEHAQIQLDYTKVKAPISGFTSLKDTDIGALVHANETKLVTITQNQTVKVEFSIPLSDFNNLKSKKWSTKDNLPIKLNLLINNELVKQEGIVDFVDVNINQKTSVVKVRAVFPNEDNDIMPGNFARVSLNNIYEENVIEIPQKALLQNDLGKSVFVVEDGIVKVKPVEIQREDGMNYILKGNSLKAGDKVIVNNFLRLAPEQKVQIDKTVN